MRFLEAFERTVRTTPWETAVVTEGGREATYERLDDRSDALARALNDEIPGGRCAVLALNGLPAIESMLAGQKRGLGTVQLPFRSGPAGIESMLERAGANGLLFDDAHADLALDVLDRVDLDLALHAGQRDLDADGIDPYEATVESHETGGEVDRSGEEYGVFFTSGTTSTPKGVLFDQEQMWYGSTQVIMEHGIDETDVALVTTPWYHMVTADAWILPHLQAGATLVVQPKFEPPETLRLIEEHDVTGLLAVPTQLDALVDVQAEERFDVDRLSYIRTGGAVVRPDLVERASERLTEGVYNTYGLTEGGPNLSFAHPSLQDEHTGTIGKESYMWELRVVEDQPPTVDPDPDAEVEPGETGEILARGPGMGTGYLDSPEAEERTFLESGWLRTGDVARVDEEGYLYVVDRIDNMIVTGGENVYPQEVEGVLDSHPDVRESVVFGREDDRWGEVVAAVVSVAGDVDEADLDVFCTDDEGLADFKRPREYVLVDEPLPRTDTGTLQRDRVVEEFSDRSA